eukprot:6205724-Pleurochrysis_carterae.AAC.1
MFGERDKGVRKSASRSATQAAVAVSNVTSINSRYGSEGPLRPGLLLLYIAAITWKHKPTERRRGGIYLYGRGAPASHLRLMQILHHQAAMRARARRPRAPASCASAACCSTAASRRRSIQSRQARLRARAAHAAFQSASPPG